MEQPRKPFKSAAELREIQHRREVAQLRQQNARLQVDSRRYQKLRRVQSNTAAKPGPVAAVPFIAADPRRQPKTGSKVLPALTPPLRTGWLMGAAVVAELKAMALETRALLRSLAATPDAQSAMDDSDVRKPGAYQSLLQGKELGLTSRRDGTTAMDAISDDAQHRIATLQAKWNARFASLADRWSRRMVADVVAQSSAQLNLGLKDIAEQTAIQSTMSTPRMRVVVEAATLNSTQLITRIPAKFLGDVQVQVMSAITTGSGLNKLVPYLTKRYKGDARHAHLTALDQVRKASESVNATRLQSLGVEEYVWIAVGGERYPRKLHHEKLSGHTFRYDDPPVIDERTGVRGKPGDAIGCRCRQRAVLNFTRMREVA